MKLLSISGQKRSGKDTSADFFVEKMNGIKYALAFPIKDALYHAYDNIMLNEQSNVSLTFDDWNGDSQYDREKPLILSNSDVSHLMREALAYLRDYYGLSIPARHQREITEKIEVMIKANTEVWSVRRLMQTLGTDIVVSLIDREFWTRCMFNAYLDARIKGYKFFIITDIRQPHEADLVRDLGATLIFLVRPELNTSTDKHVSEAGFPRLEHEPVIVNDGTLEDLKRKLLEVI